MKQRTIRPVHITSMVSSELLSGGTRTVLNQRQKDAKFQHRSCLRVFTDGHIDQEEATLARVESKTTNSEMYNFCRDPELWVGSPQFNRVYRNFQVTVTTFTREH